MILKSVSTYGLPLDQKTHDSQLGIRLYKSTVKLFLTAITFTINYAFILNLKNASIIQIVLFSVILDDYYIINNKTLTNGNIYDIT